MKLLYCCKKAGCLLLAVVMLLGMFAGCDTTGTETTDGDTTTTAPEGTDTPELKSYTVDDETAVSVADQVVATVGDRELTNGELQIYYWMGLYDYLATDTAYYLMYYYGVDFTQPLDTLVYNSETNTTWQDAMLEYCLENWHRYNALCLLAAEEGYVETELDLDYLNSIEGNLQTMAENYSYENIRQMLDREFGVGSTVEGFINYDYTVYLALNYIDSLYEKLVPTQEELETYFAENEETLASSGITKETGDVVDVRHILIKPEGGTEDLEGHMVYTDEAWAACYQKALDILEQWQEGEATEFTFSVLANQYSEDPGSNTNGGLYDGVTEGYMLEEFNDWIFDETRQYMDVDIVRTVHGYHIMFFAAREEAWVRTCKTMLVSDKINEIVEEALEKYPATYDYDKMALSNVSLISEE